VPPDSFVTEGACGCELHDDTSLTAATWWVNTADEAQLDSRGNISAAAHAL
jgi:hypothetical protein